MLDLDLLRKQPDEVAAGLERRGARAELEPILEADRRRRELVDRVQTLSGDRKRIGREIGERKRAGEDTAELEATATAAREELGALTPELEQVEGRLRDLMLELPNLPDPRVPAGGKENNQVVREWGEKPDFPEGIGDHVEIATRLGMIDFERGIKLAGRGFWLYRGAGALLEWALLDLFVREHLADGYEFMLPPHLLLEEVGYAAGQFPKFYDDVFHLETAEGERPRFLLPTAETAILSVFAAEVLSGDELPKKVFAYTPCYRREAGGYRTEERGTVRGHQFNKVELFQFVRPEQAEGALEELVGKAERIVRELGLHYRTSLLAAEDASASMAITYDVEVWVPSMGAYKEVSSASHAGNYQARRANIKYRMPDSKRSEFVHTLNASALATSRLVPALLEQHVQPDGSVSVPEPLRDRLGTDRIEPPAA
jgi:seryl-tRNA synthetase